MPSILPSPEGEPHLDIPAQPGSMDVAQDVSSGFQDPMAIPALSTQSDTAEEEVVLATFVLSGKEFAIEVQRVREAVPIPSNIIQVPSELDILEGVINLRGTVIPLLNLKKRLSFPDTSYRETSRIAITRCRDGFFGLMFDATREVLRIRRTVLSSYSHEEPDLECITEGIINLEEGRRLVQVIDPEALFSTCNLPSVSGASAEDCSVALRRVEMQKAAVFLLDGQQYALPLESIQEAIEVPGFEKRILVEDYIDGIFSLRGALTTVVDLRTFWGIEEREPDSESRVIILKDEAQLGVRVDSLIDIVEYEKDIVIGIPTLSHDDSSHAAISGLVVLPPKRNVLLLDTARLLTEDAKKQLRGNLNLHLSEQECAAANGERSTGQRRAEDGEDASATLVETFITFRLDQILAIDINCFQEILNRDLYMVRLPGQPPYMEGMLSLRGDAIPVLNLRRYYDLAPNDETEHEKVLVLNHASGKLGVVVDDVHEIFTHTTDTRAARSDFANKTLSYARHISRTIAIEDENNQQKIVLVFDMEGFFVEHTKSFQK